MAFFEVVAVIGTSSFYRIVSFKKTHLVERMGLLTLIIFGEGIIVMLKGINTVVKSFGWSKTMVGVIVSALFIVVSTLAYNDVRYLSRSSADTNPFIFFSTSTGCSTLITIRETSTMEVSGNKFGHFSTSRSISRLSSLSKAFVNSSLSTI